MKNIQSFTEVFKSYKISLRLNQIDKSTYLIICLLLSSSLPFIIYLMHQTLNGTTLTNILLPLIGTISGTHVFATLYLYISDKDLKKGVSRANLVTVVIPLFLISLNILAVMNFPPKYLLLYMVIKAHYAIVHFGRQNLGIFSFFTLSQLGRPLKKEEKFLINAMVIIGLFGTLKIFSPNYTLSPDLFVINSGIVLGFANYLHSIGKFLYLGLILATLYHLYKNKNYSISVSFMFIMIMLWYAPIFYLYQYPLLSFAAFTTAHGFQYLTILFFHSLSMKKDSTKLSTLLDHNSEIKKNKTNKRLLIYLMTFYPIILLIGVMIIGQQLWSNSNVLFINLEDIITTIDQNSILKLGFGLIGGITLAHYFVDHFIWRFNNPERRSWFKDRFDFIFKK